MTDAPLVVELVQGKESIRLVEPWDGVPAGFVSDGASVPRFLWALFGHPLDRRHRRAGVLHDWEYERAVRPRREIDAEYRDNLKVDGLCLLCRWLEFLFVSAFGGRHYGRKDKPEMEE